MKATNILKAFALISTAGLMMGNQSCQQQVAKKRELKKIVEMGQIQAPSIQLPNGKTFDFGFVANQQIFGVITDSGHFAIRSAPPLAMDPTSTAASLGDNKYFNLNKADADILQKSMAEVGQTDFKAVFSPTAWCMVNLPQLKISGSINSFEMIGGGGLSLGYSPAGAISTGLTSASVGFNVEKSQMDASFRAESALPYTFKSNWATNVTAKQTKLDAKFAISFGPLSAGPSFYYQTPLATVTKNAMTLGMNQLSSLMVTADPWYSRVFADHDVAVTVVGGQDVGFEEGDQIDIYNEEYSWSGEPCNSTLYSNVGTGTDSYYARAIITSVGSGLSRAEIVKGSINPNQGRALVGAKVKLYKLHEDVVATPAATTVASTAK